MLQLTGAYISSAELAELAGISSQNARKALSAARKGKAWRGHELAVITVDGRGGTNGRSYMVRLDSLPADLQAAYAARSATAGGLVTLPAPAIAAGAAGGGEAPGTPLPARPDGDGDGRPAAPAGLHNRPYKDWDWRLQAIAPALEHPRGSSERAAEIAAIARRGITGRDGQPRRFAPQTVWGWIRLYEQHGVAGLVRRVRKDAGARQVTVSRAWDGMADAEGIPADSRQAIAGALYKFLRSCWRADVASRDKIARLATARLIELTRPVAPHLPDAELAAACHVSPNLARRYQA
jgi:hypothetical protein